MRFFNRKPILPEAEAKQPVIEDAKGFSITQSVQAFETPLYIGGAKTVDASKNSIVVAAVKWASRAYMEAPLVTQRFNNGKYEMVPDHPATKLLLNPNKFMSGTAFWSAINASLMLDGNAYIYKERNLSGKIINLVYIPHHLIHPKEAQGSGDFISYYEYKANNVTYKIAVDDIIHFRDGIDPDNPRLGLSGLKSVTKELLTDSECSTYSHAILKNFGIAGITIAPKGDGVIEEDQADLISSLLRQRTTGEQRGAPLVLSQAVDITTSGLSPEQLALDKIRKVPEQRICAVLGVPPLILGLDSDGKTYSNMAEARESVYESWIVPMYRNVSETLNNQFLPEFTTSGMERIIYDISAVRVLQEDSNKFTDRIVKQWTSGLIKRSIAKQELGYQTEPDDDIYYFDAALGAITPTTAKAFAMNDIAQRMHMQRALVERSGEDIGNDA